MSELNDADSPHVLILRLWCEPRVEPDVPIEWRALIEHVNTGSRFPIEDMQTLHALLTPHGHEMDLDEFLAYAYKDSRNKR